MLEVLEKSKEGGTTKPPLFSVIISQQTQKVQQLDEPPPVWIKTHKPLLLEFEEFARGMDNCLGLAANQVNWKGKRLDHRFFVHRLGKKPKDRFEIVIDPVTVKKLGNPVTELEGCLSWPGMTIVAKRHLRVIVSYWTIDGEYVENKLLDRFDSQVWQHETDHLDGVTENVQAPHAPFIRSEVKIGRNDLCPCGSGKKYKKCCG